MKREEDREKECIYKSVNDEITVVKTGSQTRDTSEWISSEAEDAGSLAPDAVSGGMADKFVGEGFADGILAFLVANAALDGMVETHVLYPASLGLQAAHDRLSDLLEGFVGSLGDLGVVAGVSLAVFFGVDEAFGQLHSGFPGVAEVHHSLLVLLLSVLQHHVLHGAGSSLVPMLSSFPNVSTALQALLGLLLIKLLPAVPLAVGGKAFMFMVVAGVLVLVVLVLVGGFTVILILLPDAVSVGGDGDGECDDGGDLSEHLCKFVFYNYNLCEDYGF
jgi:hypothetical protein